MKIIIEKVLPYIIEKANTPEEFIDIQIRIFSKGYQWIDTNEIFDISRFNYRYPIYISNISKKNETNKCNDLRENFNSFKNNIVFFSPNINDYNISIIRKEKLKNINNITKTLTKGAGILY